MNHTIFSPFFKNFRDINYFAALKRVFDDRPIHCNLFVTDKCNLDCSYCTEYDNSVPHPEEAILKRRIDKVAELGVIKLALVGGEPLLHPKIDELITFAKSSGMTVSISTNGFLLSEGMVERLLKADLDIIQLSVDRKTESPVSRKSLDNLYPVIERVRKTGIKLHISGVLCADTIGEAEEVLNYGLDRDIPTEIRLMHGNLSGIYKTEGVKEEKGLKLLELQKRLKQKGKKVHTTSMLLAYQIDSLKGVETEWTCYAGYKIFFVSANGKFWPCSLLKSERDILEIKKGDLLAYKVKKACQKNCGIYCAVSNSIFLQNPLRFILGEVPSRIRQLF